MRSDLLLKDIEEQRRRVGKLTRESLVLKSRLAELEAPTHFIGEGDEEYREVRTMAKAALDMQAHDKEPPVKLFAGEAVRITPHRWMLVWRDAEGEHYQVFDDQAAAEAALQAQLEAVPHG